MTARSNLIGKRFYGLSVIEFHGITKYKKSLWKCRCDCGNEKVIAGGDLTSGRIRSCGCRRKLSDGEACLNALFSGYKRQAVTRGLCFDISKNKFRELTQGNCFYCGASPKNMRRNARGNGVYVYSGIDRLDNNQGYVDGNLVSCCEMCNIAKNNHSEEEFYYWIISVYNKFVLKSDFVQKSKGG